MKKVLILPSSSFSAFYFLFFDMEKSVGTTLPLESVFLLFKNNRLRSIQPPPPSPQTQQTYVRILENFGSVQILKSLCMQHNLVCCLLGFLVFRRHLYVGSW